MHGAQWDQGLSLPGPEQHSVKGLLPKLRQIARSSSASPKNPRPFLCAEKPWRCQGSGKGGDSQPCDQAAPRACQQDPLAFAESWSLLLCQGCADAKCSVQRESGRSLPVSDAVHGASR